MDVPNNLSPALTSLIGREREMAACREKLSKNRILTLIGPGGCGKSRLALELAHTLLSAPIDGIWAVDMGHLINPALLPNLISAAIEIAEEPGRPLLETLITFLQPRRTLLLFDNCEHVLVEAAQIAKALLNRCPHLRILATSRAPLHVDTGEATWPVLPLSLPPADGNIAPEGLMQYEAVRLFVERARARYPHFNACAENLKVIAQICSRLDGLPLAIEMVAVRARALTVQVIEERLFDLVQIPSEERRNLGPRQRTLQGTMLWSYQLLTPSEQSLWNRTAVFVDSFSLQAAEEVCAGESIEQAEVLYLLERLVENSVITSETGGSPSRFRMLQTIREFGLSQLHASGEEHLLRQRHVAWYLRYAEETSKMELCSRFERFGVELPNLRQALRWALETEMPECGLRLALAMSDYLYRMGLLSEAYTYLREALKREGTVSPALRARALQVAATVAFQQSDYDLANRYLDESLALYRALHDQKGIAYSLNALALRLGYHHDMQEKAQEMHVQALQIFRAAQDLSGIASTLNSIGFLAILQQTYHAAHAALREALDASRAAQNEDQIVKALMLLGMLAQEQGDSKRALSFYEQALPLCEAQKMFGRVIKIRFHQGAALKRLKRHKEAFDLFCSSLRLNRDTGWKEMTAYCLEGLSAMACTCGQFDRAARLSGAASRMRQSIHALPLPTWKKAYEKEQAKLRRQLGDVQYDLAALAGRSLSGEALYAYALQGSDQPATPVALLPALPDIGVEALTDRELEIVRLCVQKFTWSEIAKILSISVRTVQKHAENIRHKIGVKSRSQMALWAIRRGLA